MFAFSGLLPVFFFKKADLAGFGVRSNGLNLNPQEFVIHHTDLLNPRVQTLKLRNAQKFPQPWDFFGASVHHFLPGLIDAAASSL